MKEEIMKAKEVWTDHGKATSEREFIRGVTLTSRNQVTPARSLLRLHRPKVTRRINPWRSSVLISAHIFRNGKSNLTSEKYSV
jgi:hypothetical protein